MLSYYVYRILGAIVPRLPPRFGYWLFALLGALAFLLAKGARRAVEDNMRHVLGLEATPTRLRHVAQSVFVNQARNYYDLFRVPSISDAQIRELVTIVGKEHLDAALAEGRGAVLVSIHFGNIDIVAQAAVIYGYPIAIVAEHLKPDILHKYVCSLRGSKGITIIPADGFLKPIFRALTQNQFIALAADRETTGGGVVAEFFGAPALVPDGYVRLAMRTGVPVVPAVSMRQPDNTFVAYVEPPIKMEKTGDTSQDIQTNLRRVLAVLERYIAAKPEQWILFQPIWQLAAPSVEAE